MEYKKVKIGDNEVEIVTNILDEEIETNDIIDDFEDTIEIPINLEDGVNKNE